MSFTILYVTITRVAPGPGVGFDRKRLDDWMAARARVLRIVRLLRLAAADVSAFGAHAQIERAAAFLAALRARLPDLT